MLASLALAVVLASTAFQGNPPQANAPAGVQAPAASERKDDAKMYYRSELLGSARNDIRDRVRETVKQTGAKLGGGMLEGGDADFFMLTGTPAQLSEAANQLFSLESVIEAEASSAEVSIDFPGGTLEEFIAAVTKTTKIDSVIYESEALKSLRMRPVKLTGLDVQEALTLPSKLALESPSHEPVDISVTWIGVADPRQPGGRGGYSSTPKARLDAIHKSVCVIKSRDTARSSSATQRGVFFLEEVKPFGQGDLVPVLDAISVAIEIDGKSPTFKAKFHEPSGLLIVRGTHDELSVVAQVLRAKFPKSRFEVPEFNDSKADADKPASTPATPRR